MSSSERFLTSASSPLSEGLKRKRGRPKKQPQEEVVGPPPVKKPRGRPKGSKKVNAVPQMVEPSAEKRPRGRPRKWPPTTIPERARQEGSPVGSAGSSGAALPAAPATGGDAFSSRYSEAEADVTGAADAAVSGRRRRLVL